MSISNDRKNYLKEYHAKRYIEDNDFKEMKKEKSKNQYSKIKQKKYIQKNDNELDENSRKIIEFMRQRKEIFYTTILPEWEKNIVYMVT
jgi:hypothetical protein